MDDFLDEIGAVEQKESFKANLKKDNVRKIASILQNQISISEMGFDSSRKNVGPDVVRNFILRDNDVPYSSHSRSMDFLLYEYDLDYSMANRPENESNGVMPVRMEYTGYAKSIESDISLKDRINEAKEFSDILYLLSASQYYDRLSDTDKKSIENVPTNEVLNKSKELYKESTKSEFTGSNRILLEYSELGNVDLSRFDSDNAYRRGAQEVVSRIEYDATDVAAIGAKLNKLQTNAAPEFASTFWHTLIEQCPSTSITLPEAEGEPKYTGLGFDLFDKTLNVEGDAGDHTGYMMRGAVINVKGSAGDFVGEYMSSGIINVEKDASSIRNVNGGEINVKGSVGLISDVAPHQKNNVTINVGSKVSEIKSVDGGKIYVEGDVDSISGIIDGEIYVNGKVGSIDKSTMRGGKVYEGDKQVYPGKLSRFFGKFGV